MPARVVNVAADDLEAKPFVKERRLETVSVKHDLLASACYSVALRGSHETLTIAASAEVFANPQVTDFTGSARSIHRGQR